MPKSDETEIAGVPMHVIRPHVQPRDLCMFFVSTAEDSLTVRPVLGTDGSGAGYQFFEHATDAADHAATVGAILGTEMRIGTALLKPGSMASRIRPIFVDDDDEDEQDDGYPTDASVIAGMSSALQAAGVDSVSFDVGENSRCMIFDPARIEVKGSMRLENAAELTRRCHMLEQRNDPVFKFGMASNHFLEDEPLPAPGF